jgi:hypothetical protein
MKGKTSMRNEEQHGPADRDVIAMLLRHGFGQIERLTEREERTAIRALMTRHPRLGQAQFLRCLYLVEHLVMNEDWDAEEERTH